MTKKEVWAHTKNVSQANTQDRSTHLGSNKTFPKESQHHEKEMSHISNNNNIDKKSIYIYNIYSQLKDVQAREKRHQFNTTYSPTIYKEFKKAIHSTQPYNVTPNHVLEDFMIEYIMKASEDQQPKLTQYFIKADQVNIAEKQVVISKPEPAIDYSSLSLEELQELFERAKTLHQHGKMNVLAFELKKRGITA